MEGTKLLNITFSNFRKGCDDGDNAEACHRYSALFIKGIANVCDKNMAEAFKYSLKVSLQSAQLYNIIDRPVGL